MLFIVLFLFRNNHFYHRSSKKEFKIYWFIKKEYSSSISKGKNKKPKLNANSTILNHKTAIH